MPTLFDPTAIYEFVLPTDRDKPEDKQVKFKLRVLSKRQWIALSKVHDDFQKAEDQEEQFNIAGQIIAVGLVSWSNWKNLDGSEFAYDKSRAIGLLSDALTLNEFADLMLAVLRQGITEEDKKKFNLPSDSGTELSTTVSPALDNQGAKTNQQNTPL